MSLDSRRKLGYPERTQSDIGRKYMYIHTLLTMLIMFLSHYILDIFLIFKNKRKTLQNTGTEGQHANSTQKSGFVPRTLTVLNYT